MPRGAEEVKCSVENGYMLHDWQKVLESPVFRNGFKPMTGHNEETDNGEKKGMGVSEHAEVQMMREQGGEMTKVEVTAR